MTTPTALQIATDAIDLFLENRDVHGHDEERARAEALDTIAEYERGWQVTVSQTHPSLSAGQALVARRRRASYVCAQCGASFAAQVYGRPESARYCSALCRTRASRAARKAAGGGS